MYFCSHFARTSLARSHGRSHLGRDGGVLRRHAPRVAQRRFDIAERSHAHGDEDFIVFSSRAFVRHRRRRTLAGVGK